MTRSVRSLLRRLPKRNNQRGFTLIEMLVVISILGILAAVVTMSMVGITSTAKTNADKAELHTVQVAFDTMLAAQQLNPGDVCPAGPTRNMAAFPDSNLNHRLSPKYLHQDTTSRDYKCDIDGVVSPG